MNRQEKLSQSVLIVGAGPAGLMAAAESARRGASVTVLEKNSKSGVKILMSGGTRCNLTQNTDASGILDAFGRGSRFLRSSVGSFPPDAVVEMFRKLGVGTKVEPTGKIFPNSDRAIDVRDALHRQAIESGARILLNHGVQQIRPTSTGWQVRTVDEANEALFEADRLIVTAGGRSWPRCGTTGDAYGWLEELGHTIVRTRPALVPLVGGTAWSHELSGVTVEDVSMSVRDISKPKKPLVQRRSSLLFTHFGFSGPAPMDVSGALTEAPSFSERQLEVDWLPEMNEVSLREHLTARHRDARRRVPSLLAEWLPSRLAGSIVTIADADRTISELSKSTVHQLVHLLKQMPIPITGTRGFDKAEVTAGGVKLSEVDPKTMASRIVPNLFIAGEVLDVDGWIGGYNFQAAFSTGRAAGIAAAELGS